MQPSKNIKRFLAATILLVFAFSITPRIVLHTWFASHKDDTRTKRTHTGHHQISKLAYNCACDQIVAESPFTEPRLIAALSTFQPFSLREKIHTCSFSPAPYFLYTLRGPPVQR